MCNKIGDEILGKTIERTWEEIYKISSHSINKNHGWFKSTQHNPGTVPERTSVVTEFKHESDVKKTLDRIPIKN